MSFGVTLYTFCLPAAHPTYVTLPQLIGCYLATKSSFALQFNDKLNSQFIPLGHFSSHTTSIPPLRQPSHKPRPTSRHYLKPLFLLGISHVFPEVKPHPSPYTQKNN